MTNTDLRVLFLCTGNSARSQMAEALLRRLSNGRIECHSAGTVPKPTVHPIAVEVMRDEFNIDMGSHFPKMLDRYVGQHFDYVITTCDSAAESCPVFPGDPKRIHWGFADPAAVEGEQEDVRHAFEVTAAELVGRLRLFLSLPAVAHRLEATADA